MSDTAPTLCFLVTFAALVAWGIEMIDHARTRRMLRHWERAAKDAREGRVRAPEWYRREVFGETTDRSE